MLKKTAAWIREHPYALCLLYFIPYLIYFELLEAFAVPKFIIHCPLDDWIPFHEGFVYLILPGSPCLQSLLVIFCSTREGIFWICALLCSPV